MPIDFGNLSAITGGAGRALSVPQLRGNDINVDALRGALEQSGAMDRVREAAQASGSSAELSDMRQRLRDMEREVQSLRNPQRDASSTFLGSQNKHVSPFAKFKVDDAKGGVLPSNALNVPAGAGVGIVGNIDFDARFLSRITGTVIEFISIVASGNLSDQIELARVLLSLKINGRDAGDLFDVPAFSAAPELFGEESLYPVGAKVGPDATVEIEVEVIEALTTIDAEDLKVIAYCGDGTRYQAVAEGRI